MFIRFFTLIYPHWSQICVAGAKVDHVMKNMIHSLETTKTSATRLKVKIVARSNGPADLFIHYVLLRILKFRTFLGALVRRHAFGIVCDRFFGVLQ